MIKISYNILCCRVKINRLRAAKMNQNITFSHCKIPIFIKFRFIGSLMTEYNIAQRVAQPVPSESVEALMSHPSSTRRLHAPLLSSGAPSHQVRLAVASAARPSAHSNGRAEGGYLSRGESVPW